MTSDSGIDKESFDEFFMAGPVKFEFDSRAKRSNFVYEMPDSLLKNGRHDLIPEDKHFLKFFFQVSNSEIIENMEKFLSNYLTLSKQQKACFSKSAIRRKSLQSVLSILKHSEGPKLENILGKALESSSRMFPPKKLNQQIRIGLLKKAFELERRNPRPPISRSRSVDLGSRLANKNNSMWSSDLLLKRESQCELNQSFYSEEGASKKVKEISRRLEIL